MVRIPRESHRWKGITDPKSLQPTFATKSAQSGHPNSVNRCPLLDIGQPSLLDLQSDYAATRRAPKVLFFPVAIAAKSDGSEMAGAHWPPNSMPLGASSRTLDQEIFEQKPTFAAIQRATA